VEGFPNPSDADREFDELRARAYGPNPDIGADPPALARLRELEAAAHRTDDERRAETPTSASAAGTDAAPPAPAGSLRALAHRATETRQRRFAWAIGALVVVGGIMATVLVTGASRSDRALPPTESETLHKTAAEADSELRGLVDEEMLPLEVDSSTLRAFGSYRGLEIWSAENSFGSPCLVALHQASDVLSEWRCAPPAADLIMDVSSSGDGFEGFEGLTGDGIIRFLLRGDTVDADVYLMPEAD
jgi:hypothetical protein